MNERIARRNTNRLKGPVEIHARLLGDGQGFSQGNEVHRAQVVGHHFEN